MKVTLALITIGLAGLATAAPAVALPGNAQRREPATGQPTSDAAQGNIQSSYQCYHGDGSVQAGWPSKKQWASFGALWTANMNLLQNSCGWNAWGANNSPSEIAQLHDAIHAVAHATKVDARLILATVMQESAGCVRVPTTDNGVRNPGLMQSHDGVGSCAGTTPCPASTIRQMVHDGTAGTSAGAGLTNLLGEARANTHAAGAQNAYVAARLYNSGSANYADLNDADGSTASYANDIVNRLQGWTDAAKGCTPA